MLLCLDNVLQEFDSGQQIPGGLIAVYTNTTTSTGSPGRVTLAWIAFQPGQPLTGLLVAQDRVIAAGLDRVWLADHYGNTTKSNVTFQAAGLPLLASPFSDAVFSVTTRWGNDPPVLVQVSRRGTL